MTDNKEWLEDLDSSVKSKVRFADNSTISTEGMGNVIIERKNCKPVVIHDVLYVPSFQSSLLSLQQLLEKGFSMQMKGRALKIFDSRE